MAKPTPGSLRDLKKVARYLWGTKHLALHLWRQTFPKCISTYVESDFAGCRSTRRSTTGMVHMIGGHAVKHTSNLQGGTGLNVSECEYYGLAHGAAHGLGLRSYMADLGFEMSLEILIDSSAARAFASRRGKHDICKALSSSDAFRTPRSKLSVQGSTNASSSLALQAWTARVVE